MTERKPVLNLQAASTNNKEKPAKEKRTLFPKKDKPEKNINTRTIRFAPRTAQSVFSILFFTLFFVMCIVVLMTFGRVDTLAGLAMGKQVNKEELISDINESLKDTEQLRYEGMKLSDRLFTLSSKTEGKRNWEEQLTPYLATGLSANDLGFTTAQVNRIPRAVRFIKMETIDEKKQQYKLFYDVRFTEGDTWQQVQVILPVSYENQELRLIERPIFTNLDTRDAQNTSVYSENLFIPSGAKVPEQEEQKLTEFVQRFFDMYVTNDEKLALISDVTGLSKATLTNVDVKAMNQIEENVYFVKGTYTFYFDEGNPFTSMFTLKIKQTKDSYFVENMNGE